ncbi:glutathione S-transferase family protein [Reyranella sp.]|jgi:glutathione S-transferase|uniref:glutathione S-transferase family protein n=1 Tax=Reyranella sp. TaxID=1929291 RepID=UPI000BD28B79|nr:glutathione S-transferase family protein [Reyranella sp.]OYY35484.1 MAG: glutathione S-transferase [Rhodospirillales bacterium 35-66-84]OYZ96623.1 MAG: glutathione S-transferase [Rhodospirillales bacterium 24-66-33]OZB28050.1 MAG: glutathione S-transferase [Rhodospirillales bacterium 39-66-50]HQS18522.1 glutathione S-transferase family protein [Reyranella sp.]HQT09985.1 glutathione S-transferase family protein [Reyranella sp.]
MADELILFTHPQSRGAIAHWMLEEIGCPYRLEVKQFGPDMKSPEYLAINPMGKVPALRHGTTVVTETAAILCYLADLFPEAKLAPPPAERGAYYRWMFFVSGCCEPALADKAAGWIPDTPKLQMLFGYGSYDRTLEIVAQAVADRHTLAGDHFTAADLYMASFLHWGMLFGGIERRPVFEAYAARHVGRPASLRAQEQAAKLMAAPA